MRRGERAEHRADEDTATVVTLSGSDVEGDGLTYKW